MLKIFFCIAEIVCPACLFSPRTRITSGPCSSAQTWHVTQPRGMPRLQVPTASWMWMELRILLQVQVKSSGEGEDVVLKLPKLPTFRLSWSGSCSPSWNMSCDKLIIIPLDRHIPDRVCSCLLLAHQGAAVQRHCPPVWYPGWLCQP